MRDIETTLEQLLPQMQECLACGGTFCFKPGGISMLPLIRPNRDVVEVAALPERLKKYDLPLYRRKNGKFVLHRIVKVGQTYTCVGDGQFQEECNIEHDQMLAIVTAIIRDGKRISVQNPVYRMYCRFWHYSRKIRHVIKWPRYYLRRVFTWLKFKH